MAASAYTALPATVRVMDTTTRDGFQNIKEWIPTPTKILILDALVAAGVRVMEVTSFVSPKAIPQMADATALITHMREKYPQVEISALVPNRKGAEKAVEGGVRAVNYVISASSAHNRANINRSLGESLDDLASIRAACPDLAINLAVPTVFGCPFTGEVPIRRVLWLLGESLKRGVTSVTLSDTIGVANPVQVQGVLRAVQGAFPDLPMALHLHDTHGMALANTLAALQCGVDRFEAAAGGLGGCPFAPGAAGNVAAEDMLNMFQRMGIHTGIDLPTYLAVVAAIRTHITPHIPGRLAAARSYAEFTFYTPAQA